jgi:hypothetical protein
MSGKRNLGNPQCSTCKEPARMRPPTGAWAETAKAQGRLPEWSHVDGTPLCAVMSSEGYVPDEPEEGTP